MDSSYDLLFTAGFDGTDAEEGLRRIERAISGVLGNGPDRFRRANAQVLSDIEQSVGQLQRYAGSIDGIFKRVSQIAGFSLPLMGVTQFLNKVKEVRADFQDIESTMRVFLGSAEKASEFVEKLQAAAYYNMFEFKDLVEGSKQMIAYGVSVDQVIPRLNELSEIATATHASLGQMVSMYNRAKSVGYVDSRSMQTWASQGLVIKDVLREMGENANVTKVSFEQLNRVLDHVTSEGGMFHGVMAEQMSNISAEIGQLEDNLTSMYNEIGESLQGPLRDVIKWCGTLVEHWKEVAVAMGAAVGAATAYKAGASLALKAADEEAKQLKKDIAEANDAMKGVQKRPMDKDIASLAKGGIISQGQAEELQNLRILKQQTEARRDLKAAIDNQTESLRKLAQEQMGKHGITKESLAEFIPKAEKEPNGEALNDAEAAYEKELGLLEAIIQKRTNMLDPLKEQQSGIAKNVEILEREAEKSKELAEEKKKYLGLLLEQNGLEEGDENDSAKMSALDQADANEILAASQEYLSAMAEESADAEALEREQGELSIVTGRIQAETDNIEALAKERDTIAETKNTAATGANTAATGANTAAVGRQTFATRLSTTAKLMWANATNQVTRAMHGLKAAIITNPIGLLITAVTTLLAFLPMFKKEEEETTVDMEKFGESAVKATSKVNSLHDVLKKTSATSKAHKDALKELKKTYEEYGIKVKSALTDELNLERELNQERDRAILLIKEKGRLNILAAAKESYQQQLKTKSDDFKKSLKERIGDWADTHDAEIDDVKKEAIAELITQAFQEEEVAKAARELMQWKEEFENAPTKVNQQNIQRAREELNYRLVLSQPFADAENLLGGDATFLINNKVGFFGSDGMLDKAIAFGDAVLETEEKVQQMNREMGISESVTDGLADSMENLANKSMHDLVLMYGEAEKCEKSEEYRLQMQQDHIAACQARLKELTGQDYSAVVTIEGLEQAAKDAGLLQTALDGFLNFLNGGTYKTSTTDIKKLWQDKFDALRTADDYKGFTSEIDTELNIMDPSNPLYSYLQSMKYRAQKKNPSSYMEADLGRSRRYQASEKEREEARRLARQRQDNEAAYSDFEVWLMQDGLAKERAEAERKYEKARLQAERAVEDEMEAERKRRRDKWKSEGPNRKDEDWADDWTQEQYRQAAEKAKNYYLELEKAKAEHDKEMLKLHEEELNQMWQYWQEYGTVLQQRLASEQEYDEKIRKAREGGDVWQVRALEAQKRSALGGIDARALAMDIDWGMAFEGVGTVLEDMAKETLERLEEYMKTKEYKELSASDKQAYADLREKLRSEVDSGTSAFDFGQWGKIADLTRSYQNSVKKLQEATDKHKQAIETAKKANEAWEKETDPLKKQILKTLKDYADEQVEITGQDVENAQEEKDESQDKLATASRNAQEGLESFAASLSQMSSGSLKGFANGLGKLIENINGGSNAVSEFLQGAGKIGGIVGAILSILDAMGDNPTQFITGLIDKIGGAIAALLSDLPNLFVGVVGSVGNLLKNVAGGLLGIFGLDLYGGNRRKVARDTEYLARSNDRLRESIDELSENIAKYGGIKSIEAFEEAKSMLDQEIEQQRAMLQMNMWEWGGGHHSNAYYLGQALDSDSLLWAAIAKLTGSAGEMYGKEMSQYMIDAIYALTQEYGSYNMAEILTKVMEAYAEENGKPAKTINTLDDLIGLSPEELAWIKTHEPALWEYITSYGYNDKQEYWEAMAALAGEADKLSDSLKQSMTGTTFDSLRSNFASALADMGKDASSFADDFEKMLFEAVLNAKISDTLDGQLQEFYDDWAAMAESDGMLDENEINELKERYQAIVQQGIDLRDQAAAITGYEETYRQSATGGGFATASQDSINELSGRFLAVQVLCTDIRDAVRTIEEQHKAAQENTAGITESLGLLQWYQQQALGELESINRNTRELYQMNERLGLIEQHTKTLE